MLLIQMLLIALFGVRTYVASARVCSLEGLFIEYVSQGSLHRAVLVYKGFIT
jgi:hypothetical protein